MSYQPLFVTNTARSGSYLISMMMSANPEMMVASEPYLELFRSLRNALIRTGSPQDVLADFDPSSPMQDHYFTDSRFQMMDAIQNGDLNVAYDQSEWDEFLQRSIPRVSLQCPELAPHLARMRGDTYKELFDNGLELIAETRNARDKKWVGIKDAWIIEFFGPLAVAYPEAKFIVILRDPRAMVNSMLGIVNEDPTQIAHVLSYARHWRKYVAFLTYYRTLPVFKGRLFFLTHEQVLGDPERKSREVCEFLDVDYDPAMLDTEHFHDYSTGRVWNGNSSFEKTTKGISMHRAERWKTKLEPRIVKAVDFVCGPDMKLTGIQPLHEIRGPDEEVLSYLLESDKQYTNWRSDLGDVQQDYSYELLRHALIDFDHPIDDSRIVRRSFLFREVYDALRAGQRSRMAA